VLFSGGQDSTTCLYWAKDQYETVRAISFSYGQRHSVELGRATIIAHHAGVEHRVARFDIGPSTSPLANTLKKADFSIDPKNDLPRSFVPGRNLIMLSLAAAWAYEVMQRDGTKCDLVIGANAVDYSGYPDCRASTMAAMERALRLGLDAPLDIVTPIIGMSKKEIVRLAGQLPGCWEALGKSWSCYDPQTSDDLNMRPCGVCPACVIRAKGFADAGHEDPAL
jgi:7-cyano-7-deazaguanine synthase